MAAASPFTILCGDGIKWLQKNKGALPAVLASIPEMSEVGLEEAAYDRFFRKAAAACLAAVEKDGYAMFIQTDRKKDGIIDKSYLISDEAEKLGLRMMFHKIALIRDVDGTDLYKPTYSHVLCYSRGGTPGAATPDVFERGKVLYSNGAGIEATKRLLEFVAKKGINFIIDPFIGRGTTLIVAKHMGFLGGIGIDIDPKQCKEAEANLNKVWKKL